MILVNVLLLFYHWIRGIILFFLPRRWRHKDISNETVLITGAGNGLGRELALRLAKLASHVVLWDIDEEGLQETTRMIKSTSTGTCTAYVVDLTDRKNVYETAETVKKEVGRVSILVNNAGTVLGKRLLDAQDDKIIKVYEVNTFANYWTCKAFLPEMRAWNHGQIVTIDSVCGFAPASSLTEYCGSKYATYGFHEALHLENDEDGYNGIKFTLVCPYQINTALFHGAKATLPALKVEYVAHDIVEGLLSDQEYVYIPSSFIILHWLKAVLPYAALRQLSLIMVTENFMKNCETKLSKS